MTKILIVAWREFTSVVFTKGFIIGVLMVPAMMTLAIGAIYLLKNQPGPRITGRVAVIDKTGITAERVREQFSEAAIAREERARSEQVNAEIDKATRRFNLPPEQTEQAKSMAGTQAGLLTPRADLSVEVLAADADPETSKDVLRNADIFKKDQTPPPLLAVAVVPPEATRASSEGAFGKFDLFVAPKLDIEIQRTIERRVGLAIVEARVAADPRASGAGLSSEYLRAMMERPNIDPVTVTRSGDKKSLGEVQMFIPMGFMILMLISVMTTGQYLMTTVVEEKSNRVMEVLLSAVSPFQLMVGKIIGHMTVGALIVLVYGGLGIAGLIAFALTQFLTPGMLALLICYFLIASVTMAAFMAAIGSAVNELREAQTLQTPVIMVVMIPWLTWIFIQRAPNSTFATILSFLPAINPFVMTIRMAGSEPIPAWHHPVALAVGAATMFVSLWAAAKIFRIGVLMYGKPPDFKTLFKWVRMA